MGLPSSDHEGVESPDRGEAGPHLHDGPLCDGTPGAPPQSLREVLDASASWRPKGWAEWSAIAALALAAAFQLAAGIPVPFVGFSVVAFWITVACVLPYQGLSGELASLRSRGYWLLIGAALLAAAVLNAMGYGAT